MRGAFRLAAFAGVALAASLLTGRAAMAQGYGYGGYPGVPYGGGYSVPGQVYYGNGGHDFQPHWHTRQTPFGGYSYFGLGRHDFRPHAHVETPQGITSYSNGRFSSTQSYAPPAPYVYRPW